jgi:hypothetical protein
MKLKNINRFLDINKKIEVFDHSTYDFLYSNR